MQNEIIINAVRGETRVALLERSAFAELYIERDDERSVVGNVVKGRVSRVLPGMQAAFVDIGLEKAGFLYVGDYHPNVLSDDGSSGNNGGGRRRGRGRGNSRSLPNIETVLQEGQEIVVQIAKEPIGTKGARITSNISIPGRHLVLTPGAGRIGVSRRIDSDKERRRLRDIVSKLRVGDLGFIIRTAGHGVREADLEADVRYLTSVWEEIRDKNEELSAPAVLYSELDLPLKMIRDFANDETKRIAIDSERVYDKLRNFVDKFVADPKPKVEHYEGSTPIFDDFELESKIHDNLERKVGLKSGGHLVIDQSEALTAIDVNTGRYTGKRDLEETILRTNLEAVREVVYQLRFRNIGGLIIIDLIDMESGEHREKVYRTLQEALRGDKSRTNILKISELGLVEMTRKRTRENLMQTLCEPCDYCEGRGYVLSRASVAFKVLREIRNDLPRFCGRRIAITVCPQVAEQLLGAGRNAIEDLGQELGREIEVRARPGLHQEQFEVTALDGGDPIQIPLRWLDDAKKSESAEGEGRKKRGGRRGRRGSRPSADKDEGSNADAAAEDSDANAAKDSDDEASDKEGAGSSSGPKFDRSALSLSEEVAAELAHEGGEPASSAEATRDAPVDEESIERPTAFPDPTPEGSEPATAEAPTTVEATADDTRSKAQPDPDPTSGAKAPHGKPLEAEDVATAPDREPERAPTADEGAAGAEACAGEADAKKEAGEKPLEPTEEAPEVLDETSESRILAGSLNPEEK